MSFSAVLIVGSGPLGAELAWSIAVKNIPVRITSSRALLAGDTDDDWMATTEQRLKHLSETNQEPLSRVTMARAELALSHEADDLVIEASFRAPDVRRAALATLESRLTSSVVLSALGTAQETKLLAAGLTRPDQFVGFEFERNEASKGTGLIVLHVLPETAPGVAAACQTFCGWLKRPSVARASEFPGPHL